MADLITTVTESVTLNGASRGSTNTITTSGINDVLERITTCVHSQETTIALFATANYTSPAAIDVENVAYARVTNLSTTDAIYLAVVGTATNYTIKLRPESSHIIFNGEELMVAEADTSPAFASYEDITKFIVKPASSTDCQVELFVGLT
ncbi:MAG: hypothetical protein Tp178DCM178821_26 [Prokaryotic dsDNA virus sp.]|nr:MAG: hypothetical protein Tp178DCM178821_26 [Prokaryotic dsDNA virus sp.]|tara:strand:+ start:9083 stop:9532 length:450 start_codon:yes stop_codon:yes gene_type:complete